MPAAQDARIEDAAGLPTRRAGVVLSTNPDNKTQQWLDDGSESPRCVITAGRTKIGKPDIVARVARVVSHEGKVAGMVAAGYMDKMKADS